MSYDYDDNNNNNHFCLIYIYIYTVYTQMFFFPLQGRRFVPTILGRGPRQQSEGRHVLVLPEP